MRLTRFDVNDAGERDALLRKVLPDALEGLREGTRPRWGKMSAQQMLEHLEWAFAVSTGRLTVGCAIPEAQLERVRTFLHDQRPTPRDYMNPLLAAGLPPLRHASLDEARLAVVAEAGRFLDECEAGPGTVRTHPVFGPIPLDAWTRSHYKHTYHHLLQFGLIAGA
jgi:oxepin-CoA hydrolase/3-oxo-5,6-dehydrosuberyl-CoA semialdehyde dehydrogenase